MLPMKRVLWFVRLLVVLFMIVFIIEPKSQAQEAVGDGPQLGRATSIQLAERKRKSRSSAANSHARRSSNVPSSGPNAEVGGYFSYASVNQEITSEAGSGSENGSNISISASYLMILQGKYGLGPILTYSSSSQGESSSSSHGIGASGKYYFSDLREQMIPYVACTLQISGRSQTYSDIDETTGESTTSTDSGSGFGYALGGGLHYLLRRTVSISPELQYYSNSLSANGTTMKESGIRLLAGFVVFL